MLLLCLFALLPFHLSYPSSNHIQTAVDLMSKGNLEAAEKEARMALNSRDTRALAWATLGTIRLQQNEYDEGAEFLGKALRLNPHLVGARISLGGVYLLQGKKDKAGVMFREALRIDPDNFNARLDLAQLESDNGDYKASLEAARPIAPELRQSAEGLVLLATDYLGLQQKDSLRALLPDWKALQDASPDLSTSFASVLIKSGLAQEGVEILEKAGSNATPSFDLNFALAGGYQSMGDLTRASASYETALSLREDCVACLMGIAHIAEKQGDSEKALAYLIKAKRIEPENPEILFRFGKVCLERDLYDDAIAPLQKAAALRPENDSYTYVLGSAHVAKKEYKKARELFEKLLKKHPSDAVLSYALGSVLYLDQNLDEAENYLGRSIELDPRQRAAYYYLGLVAERKGAANHAMGILRDLIERYPDYAPAYEALGSLLVKVQNYTEAQERLEKAVLLNPDSVKAHYQLGMLLGRLGKTEESRLQIETAKRLESQERAKNELQLHLLMPD